MKPTQYNAAIRKIFDTTHCGAGLAKCFELADLACYRALTFNGAIYIKIAPKQWVETPFNIQDFEV